MKTTTKTVCGDCNGAGKVRVLDQGGELDWETCLACRLPSRKVETQAERIARVRDEAMARS
jgi:hypothetical protein